MKFYNPICYSLYTDNVEDKECLKRRFSAFDIVNSCEIEIFVCAEYFRLLYDKHRDSKSWQDIPFKALEEAISEYVPYWDYFNDKNIFGRARSNNSFQNITIPYLLIERPKFWTTLSLDNAFRIILENQSKAKDLKITVATALINWSESKTLAKDQKIRKLVKEAFGIDSYFKGKFSWMDISIDSVINEIDFIDLIVHLTNKAK